MPPQNAKTPNGALSHLSCPSPKEEINWNAMARGGWAFELIALCFCWPKRALLLDKSNLSVDGEIHCWLGERLVYGCSCVDVYVNVSKGICVNRVWFYNNFVVSISRFFITVSCLLYSLPVFHSQLFAYFYNKSTPAVIETRPFTAISSHICVLLTSLV